ncbi:MAG: hydrogenase iron-sulfur subunit [Syntrophobacteraceae bacterium]
MLPLKPSLIAGEFPINKLSTPCVFVYVCRRCLPEPGCLPRQWTQDGVRVQVIQLPCSGKTDIQYLLHAIEGGAQGLLVVACLAGECRLAQGNHRAEIRIRTVRRLLAEIGMESERAALVRCGKGEDLKRLVREAVGRFIALGGSPIGAADAGALRGVKP